jgi:FMN phosphatase YigB (HAD superfamily)
LASSIKAKDSRIICDLDGTLVDSQTAIVRAYYLAGWNGIVPFGQPWREWCPEDIYRRKQEVYRSLYGDLVRRGPASGMGDKGCYVLTTASLEAWDLAREHFYPKLRLLAWGKTVAQKVLILRSVSTPNTIYIDDDKSTIILMQQAGVKACLIWCSSSPHAATAREPQSEASSLSSPSLTGAPCSSE